MTSMALHDEIQLWPVRSRSTKADAKVFSFVTDEVVGPGGDVLKRSYLHHPGAVGVVALDEEDRVVVVHQYRHPVGLTMVELPAGLLDVAGEDYLAAARRELAEEAELAADDWRVLVDFCASPGSTQESIRIYLARGLHPVERPHGFVVEGEEADMVVSRVPLVELVDAVLAGELNNGVLAIAVLALWARRDRLDELRSVDAPWTARAAKEAQDAAQQG